MSSIAGMYLSGIIYLRYLSSFRITFSFTEYSTYATITVNITVIKKVDQLCFVSNCTNTFAIGICTRYISYEVSFFKIPHLTVFPNVIENITTTADRNNAYPAPEKSIGNPIVKITYSTTHSHLQLSIFSKCFSYSAIKAANIKIDKYGKTVCW